jgi:hypothetical protein
MVALQRARYAFDAYLRGKYLKLGEPLPPIGGPLVLKPASAAPETIPEEDEFHEERLDNWSENDGR